MKKAITGIQPTNGLHIGNLFGALLPAVKMQDDYNLKMMVVDYHAITQPQEPQTLHDNILFATAAYLAAGIDPNKTVIFQQSALSEHTELAWIMQTIAYIGEAKRMTQFKDKSGKKEDAVSVGLFTYPMLQAADILLHDIDAVPVGEDQKQHIELTRDLAQRFNQKFGETFVVPEHHIPKEGARIKSLQDPSKKMSKSDPSEKNYILLTDDAEKIRKKIRSAITDSQAMITLDPARAGLYNLITIFSLASGKSPESIAEEYKNQGMKELKDSTSEALIAIIDPLREKIESHLENSDELKEILEQGAKEAQKQAEKRLQDVKEKLGIIL